MFNFFNEIKQVLNLKNDYINDFNIINLSNKIIYVEGHYKITYIDTNCIKFNVKKQDIKIDGNNLEIKQINKNTMLICGDIKSVANI